MAGKIKKRITHFRQYKGLIRTVPSAVKQRGLLPNVNHLPEWGAAGCSHITTHNLTPSKIRAFIVMKIDLSGVLKPRGVAIIITDLHNRFLDLGHNPLKLFLTMGRIAAEYCVS